MNLKMNHLGQLIKTIFFQSFSPWPWGDIPIRGVYFGNWVGSLLVNGLRIKELLVALRPLFSDMDVFTKPAP